MSFIVNTTLTQGIKGDVGSDGVPGNVGVDGSNISSMVHEDVLLARDFTTQTVPVYDVPMAITLGVAQFTASDPVSLDALGNITINQTGAYFVTTSYNTGRLSATGIAVLLTTLYLDGVQITPTSQSVLDTSVIVPGTQTETLLLQLNAGQVLTGMMMEDRRGASGNDSGLYPGVVTGSIFTNIPSASITISRYTP